MECSQWTRRNILYGHTLVIYLCLAFIFVKSNVLIVGRRFFRLPMIFMNDLGYATASKNSENEVSFKPMCLDEKSVNSNRQMFKATHKMYLK